LSEIYEKSPQIWFVPKNAQEHRGLTHSRCNSTTPAPRSGSSVRMASRDELKYQLEHEMLAKTIDKQKTELLSIKKERDALKKQMIQNAEASEKTKQQMRDSEALLEVAEVARIVAEKDTFSIRDELSILKEHVSSLTRKLDHQILDNVSLTKKYDSLKKISRL